MLLSTKEILLLGIKKGQIPEFIYKYTKINNNLYSMIRDSFIWYSSKHEFNDPFDCNLKVDSNPSLKDIDNYLGAIQPNLSRTDRRSRAKEFHKDKGKFLNTISNNVDAITSRYGICCFSQINDNILMWAHYSDSHHGVCLKYYLPDLFDDEVNPLRIKYSKTYPSFDYVKNRAKAQQGDLAVHMFGTKSIDWNYEAEYRLIIEGHGQKSIPISGLQAVYFGLYCEANARNETIELIEKNSYKTSYYQAYMKEREFGLKFKKIS